MKRRTALLALVALTALAACTPTDSSDVDSDEPDPQAGTAPTQESIDAGAVFSAVPEGYDDCGATILTSGWPTTTMYVVELQAQCILEAAESGSRSQYVYWGRDDRGGLQGTILRIEAPGEILQIDYTVAPDGTVGSTTSGCAELTDGPTGPPICDQG